MSNKWKSLIISIIIYQVIFSIITLSLIHYSHWMQLNGPDFADHWYQFKTTRPLKIYKLVLGITLLILIVFNIFMFKKDKH